MKGKLTKLITFIIIFLLWFNPIVAFSMITSKDPISFSPNKTDSYLYNRSGVDPQILKIATSSGPHTLELVDSWDGASNNVLEQVIETLFARNLSDPLLPRINLLTQSYWWENQTTLQIELKQDILFHDYTPFNAAAAKWNLDRLLYLTNCFGNNTGEVAHTQSLWMFPDEMTPIINQVATVGDWNITIFLNAPYGPLLDLLCYINAGMISPTAHAAKATTFLSLSDVPVGTGPFKYVNYTPDVEVRLTRWDNYWRGLAYFDELLYVIFNDAMTAHNAFLNYEIDINFMASDQNLVEYEADPNIKVVRFTDETGIPSLIYQYLGFNNKKYNLTWRKAFSYAFNYSYVIDEMRLGNAVRAYSAISPGYGAAYNESLADITVPDDGDLAVARQTMVDMGFGSMSWDDAQWIAIAESGTSFLTVPYHYNLGNTFREDLGVAVTEWLKLIGVATNMIGLTWAEFLTLLFDQYDELGIYAIGWAPDYLDPFNMMDPLFNPVSWTNSAQVNDTILNYLLNAALYETNTEARNVIYKNCQARLVEGYFHAPLYHSKLNYAHLTRIEGYPYNAMNSFYAYPIYSTAPGSFLLTSNAGTPDDDGNFDLFWTASDGADNYTVYQDSEYISNFHEGLISIAEEITDLSLYLNGYPEGVYYFIVAANNEYGYSLSNCIEVIVEMVDEHDLEVYLEIPSGIEVGNIYTITAMVRNIGFNDETDVDLFLYIDDILVDSLSIPYLSVGENRSILYEWTPIEYKTYSFKAYAPAVEGETTINDNIVVSTVHLIEMLLFDGLFVEYTFIAMDYYIYETNFTYTPYQDGLFYETWNIYDMGTYQWVVDPTTRIMSQYSLFGDGAHTPVWIFTNISLGDTILIAVDGEGDHLFNVSEEFIYELPGFGPIEVWLVEDLMYPGGYAWYEKSTGILLHGLFYYYDGIANYTFDFVNTNAQFTYLGLPGELILSSDADDPDIDGMFTLFWSESENAENYSVYQSSNHISKITPELTLLAEGITDLSLLLEGYIDGTYYFIVVAHNADGSTLSNCIRVNVELKLPPTIMFDTIPEEMIMTYTRASQVIGSVTAFSTSQIVFVGLIGETNFGFALSTTYTFDERAGIFLSETTLITTNQLESGIHELTLRIYNIDGMSYDKVFTIIVYRQAELNLRGEFDYLLKERVKISVVAQAFDIEDKFILEPNSIEGLVVHIKITDYDGNVKVEDRMTYNTDGFFHWDSDETIRKLWDIFPKGVYIVLAWIEFPADSYYIGGIDVIQFHIDPPNEGELDPWFIFGMIGLCGLIGSNIALTVVIKRKRSIE